MNTIKNTSKSNIEMERNGRYLDGLQFLWLELLQQCNLTCSHCYAESSPLGARSSLTVDQWRSILVDARGLGCRNVQFIGGEPLVYPHLKQLLAATNDLGYDSVEIYTNGTLISDRWIEVFERTGVRLALSFYSHSAESHDRIVGSPGSFHKTKAALKAIVAARIPVRIGLVELPINHGDVAMAKQMLCDMGISNIRVDRMRNVGRANQHVAAQTREENYSELCGQCWKGRLCVAYTGEAYPCVFSRAFGLGVATDGLKHILEGEELRGFRKSFVGDTRKTEITACDPHIHDDCSPFDKDCAPDCNPGECNPTDGCTPEYACNPNF